MKNNKIQVPKNLFNAAKQAHDNAYAPYSEFQVGAAALTESGKVFMGCNVENASYGLTQCAERNCIANAVVEGEQRFKLLVLYTEQKKLTPPCGACRQVIAEFFEYTARVVAMNHIGEQQEWTIQDLLPDAFTPKDLLNN